MFYCVVLNCLKSFYTALYHIILHAAESLLGQPPKMTEEQMENARKRMEENLREDTQQTHRQISSRVRYLRITYLMYLLLRIDLRLIIAGVH